MSAQETTLPVSEQETVSFWEGMDFFLGYFKPYRSKLIWSAFFHVIEMTPHMAFPIVTMFIVDYLIPAQNKSGLFHVLFAIILLLSITALFFTAYRATYIRILTNASRDLRNTIVRRLQILSLSFHNRNHTGRYYSKIMTDVERTQNFADTFMQQGVSIVVMSAISVVVLAAVNWRIMLIMLTFVPVFQGVRSIFRQRMRLSRKDERQAREALSATVSNFLQSSLLARMHGHEGYENRKVDSSNAVVSEKSVGATADMALFSVVSSGCTIFFHFLVVVFCARAVIDGTLSFGEMLLFNAYSNRIMTNFQQMLDIYPQVTIFCESVTSIKEVVDAPDIEYNHGKRKVESLEGRIVLDKVSFAYDNQPAPVLNDVSVDIKPGMVVGLVGKSGSGKSTFVNLVLGLYRTGEGIVSIDDMSVDSVDMRTVRRHMGVVSQTPVLFSGTVYDNIVHAYHDVPMERVIDAAEKANAHEFIMQLPKGYDSDVGENGVLLSGGQKQRIALARTILRNPAILILDEATSALDSESEKLVQGAIDRLSRKMTTLVIAHRLSTVRNADLILVFKDGAVIERGTHEELLQMNSEYANLLMYQSLDHTPVEIHANHHNDETSSVV